MPATATPRVLIVAEDASARFGGEAALPLHYFRHLRRRGVETWLITHARTRSELSELLGDQIGRVTFIPDTRLHRALFAVGRRLPARLSYLTFGFAMRLWTQWLARRAARTLIARHKIDIVHQPTPVSPKEPSLVAAGLPAPVVIGPMNGGMEYPPGFGRFEGPLTRALTVAGRRASWLLNVLIPGKRRAAALLVANERTRRALPPGLPRHGEPILLVENGVDLALWQTPPEPTARVADQPSTATASTPPPTRFVFLGRLVDWKCVDLLLEAFAAVAAGRPVALDIVGDGPMRPALEAHAARLGLADRIAFRGWLPQAECPALLRRSDVLVLPSIFECGGAVVLEAMACGVPVIATDWGGPADYLDASCGILVAPTSRAALVEGLSAAMAALADDPARRAALGAAGRRRVEDEFDWAHKIERILAVYHDAIGAAAPVAVPPPVAARPSVRGSSS